MKKYSRRGFWQAAAGLAAGVALTPLLVGVSADKQGTTIRGPLVVKAGGKPGDPILILSDEAGNRVAQFQMGSVASPGAATLVLPRGDIINVRNIQGGMVDDPNLDVGAGDGAEHRGVLSLNYDVGQSVQIFDGRKAEIARFPSEA